MEQMRLQKFMAECGVASRRGAEEIIAAGRVKVNGQLVSEQGVKINPEQDQVTVDDRLILPERKKYYIMLNKPSGYVTTVSDQFERPTVMDLIKADISSRLYPVGRLDYETEGLLLLTNDGDFAYRMTHPKHQINKTYLALVKGTVAAQALHQLEHGVIIDGKKTAPAQVSVAADLPGACKLKIIIHEGRNRQVRKMCEAVGHSVISLKRISLGNVQLGNLPIGKWRHLRTQEIQELTGENND